MKKTTVFGINLFTGLLFICASTLKAQDTSVKVTGIRSQKGNIVINVFKDQESYDRELAYKKFTFNKKEVDKGMMKVKFLLGQGIYGITLIDDENSNGKIDKNLIGMPKEGFGFSNFYMEKMKKPTFDDFKVDLKSQPKIEIRVKYM